MSTELITLILNQGPVFAILIGVGYVFYKFLDRTYTDHYNNMTALQDTFKESIIQITNTLGGRLDKIEDTLMEIKKK